MSARKIWALLVAGMGMLAAPAAGRADSLLYNWPQAPTYCYRPLFGAACATPVCNTGCSPCAQTACCQPVAFTPVVTTYRPFTAWRPFSWLWGPNCANGCATTVGYAPSFGCSTGCNTGCSSGGCGVAVSNAPSFGCSTGACGVAASSYAPASYSTPGCSTCAGGATTYAPAAATYAPAAAPYAPSPASGYIAPGPAQLQQVPQGTPQLAPQVQVPRTQPEPDQGGAGVVPRTFEEPAAGPAENETLRPQIDPPANAPVNKNMSTPTLINPEDRTTMRPRSAIRVSSAVQSREISPPRSFSASAPTQAELDAEGWSSAK